MKLENCDFYLKQKLYPWIVKVDCPAGIMDLDYELCWLATSCILGEEEICIVKIITGNWYATTSLEKVSGYQGDKKYIITHH